MEKRADIVYGWPLVLNTKLKLKNNEYPGCLVSQLLKPKGMVTNDSIIPKTKGKMILKGIVKLTCNGQADILE